MSNLEKYNTAFIETLQISPEALVGLKYQDVASWDSIGHMQLISALEEEFGIEMEIDDIIDFSGYEAGKSILLKYKVDMAQ